MWLKIKEGETVNAVIDFSSVKAIAKHWTGSRSELCLGQGCPRCTQGIPLRTRYQVRLIVNHETANWEFGEQAMIELKDIPHESNLAAINITRLGTERNTRYQISAPSEAKPDKEYSPWAATTASDFLRRKYGHTYEAKD